MQNLGGVKRGLFWGPNPERVTRTIRSTSALQVAVTTPSLTNHPDSEMETVVTHDGGAPKPVRGDDTEEVAQVERVIVGSVFSVRVLDEDDRRRLRESAERLDEVCVGTLEQQDVGPAEDIVRLVGEARLDAGFVFVPPLHLDDNRHPREENAQILLNVAQAEVQQRLDWTAVQRERLAREAKRSLVSDRDISSKHRSRHSQRASSRAELEQREASQR